MRLSPLGRRFIQAREGLRLTAYPDGKNADGSPRYSVGYGHNGVPAGTTITKADAERLFDSDVASREQAVNTLVAKSVRPTTQQQFDALVSFAYNVGLGAFQTSSPARLHQAGEYQAAADALRAWTKSGGETNPELVNRREAERNVYLGGSYGVSGVGLVTSPKGGLLVGLGVAAGAYLLLSKMPGLRRVFA